MGADNQAERVIARIEYREQLAEVFHRAFRKEQDLAPPWGSVSDAHRRGVIAGVTAIINAINERTEGDGS